MRERERERERETDRQREKSSRVCARSCTHRQIFITFYTKLSINRNALGFKAQIRAILRT